MWDNSKEAFASGCRACADALKNWSDSERGKRKGRKVGFPRFKAKSKTKPSFCHTTGRFGLAENDSKAVLCPKVGRVHCFEDVAQRCGSSRVKRMTISYQEGRWFASLLVEREGSPKRASFPRGRVGCDLGVRALVTLSDGTVIENPRFLQRSLRRLAKAQHKLARCKKGSRRRALQKARVAKLYARVVHQRADAIHKLTTWLVSTHSSLVIEDLNVSGMGKNHALAEAIADASFGEFRRQVEYKAERTGCEIVVANRWFPSSRTCSRCGHVQPISLAERTYVCSECGLVMDRDLNAAINLCNYSEVAGSAPETLNAHGGEPSRTRSESWRKYPEMCEPTADVSQARSG